MQLDPYILVAYCEGQFKVLSTHTSERDAMQSAQEETLMNHLEVYVCTKKTKVWRVAEYDSPKAG